MSQSAACAFGAVPLEGDRKMQIVPPGKVATALAMGNDDTPGLLPRVTPE